MIPSAEIDWPEIGWTFVRKVLNYFGFLLAMAVLLALSPKFARRIGKSKDASATEEKDRRAGNDDADR